MCKTNKLGGWFYYIGNSKPWLTIPRFHVYCNKRRMGGKSSITLKVDSTFMKETRVHSTYFNIKKPFHKQL